MSSGGGPPSTVANTAAATAAAMTEGGRLRFGGAAAEEEEEEEESKSTTTESPTPQGQQEHEGSSSSNNTMVSSTTTLNPLLSSGRSSSFPLDELSSPTTAEAEWRRRSELSKLKGEPEKAGRSRPVPVMSPRVRVDDAAAADGGGGDDGDPAPDPPMRRRANSLIGPRVPSSTGGNNTGCMPRSRPVIVPRKRDEIMKMITLHMSKLSSSHKTENKIVRWMSPTARSLQRKTKVLRIIEYIQRTIDQMKSLTTINLDLLNVRELRMKLYCVRTMLETLDSNLSSLCLNMINESIAICKPGYEICRTSTILYTNEEGFKWQNYEEQTSSLDRGQILELLCTVNNAYKTLLKKNLNASHVLDMVVKEIEIHFEVYIDLQQGEYMISNCRKPATTPSSVPSSSDNPSLDDSFFTTTSSIQYDSLRAVTSSLNAIETLMIDVQNECDTNIEFWKDSYGVLYSFLKAASIFVSVVYGISVLLSEFA